MNALLAKSLMYPVFNKNIQADKEHGYCYACGEQSSYVYEEIIHDDLARQWGVNDAQRHAYSSRESRQCQKCGATHRNRQMARAMCANYGKRRRIRSLKMLVEDDRFQKLRFTEINACGGLHQFFIRQGNMVYSEYEPEDKSVRSEDLHNLSYEDNTFDLVATSDTLEHIPEYEKAFEEIHRVLKPGGKHIFTIPIIWKNKTRIRAHMTKSGKIKHLVDEPAYHGPAKDDNLVWTDFGYDVLEVLENKGFKTRVLYYNLMNSDDAGCVFVSTKEKN